MSQLALDTIIFSIELFQQCTSVKYALDEEYVEKDITEESDITQEEKDEDTEDDYDVYADVMRQEAGICDTFSETTFQEGHPKCSSTRYFLYLDFSLYNWSN